VPRGPPGWPGAGRATGAGRRPAANVGITRFQVRRSTTDPIGYEILAEVTNQSDEPADNLRLAVALNGRPVDIKPLKLAPNARWSEVLENTTVDGGLLTAELVVKGEKGDTPYPDALAADNKGGGGAAEAGAGVGPHAQPGRQPVPAKSAGRRTRSSG
jgi:hypothetical protein